ncbi:MAG: hypothetical protein IKZ25_05195 [Clostridia bacterium]|nr:hypothetical protein [Clostridia bacterium]
MKWYNKILWSIGMIILSPFLFLFAVIAFICSIPNMIKTKEQYYKSEYYKDFNVPFTLEWEYSSRDRIRFYNNIKKRNLHINYKRQKSNGFEYFVFEDVIYMFPDFDYMNFDKENSIWIVDYDGEWQAFDIAYKNLVSKFDCDVDVSCVKLLIERNMFYISDLDEVDVPNCIFVTWSYDSAFSNDEPSIKKRLPQSIQDIFEIMNQIQGLCGNYYISDDGCIVWDLYDSFQVYIFKDPENYEFEMGILKIVSGKVESELTHWHPSPCQIYDEICKMGKKGNVIVIKTFLNGAGVLYSGAKENCPYKKQKKRLFGKMYFLESK